MYETTETTRQLIANQVSGEMNMFLFIILGMFIVMIITKEIISEKASMKRIVTHIVTIVIIIWVGTMVIGDIK